MGCTSKDSMELRTLALDAFQISFGLQLTRK